MTAGVALFGVFTSFLANTFLSPRKKPEKKVEAAPTEGVSMQLHELKRLLEEQEKTAAVIRERLEEIEETLTIEVQ
jgi:hypothetical protein